MYLATALIVLLLALALAVWLVNRLTPIDFGAIRSTPAPEPRTAGDTLSVLTWNIGFAGLGARADFIIDGGKHLRALRRHEIDEAAEAIGDTLPGFDAEVILLQEMAGPGFLTRGVDVRKSVLSRLAQHGTHFWADFRTLLIPPPLRIEHGMLTAATLRDGAPKILELPQDARLYGGALKKYYAGLMTTYPIGDTGRNWVLINIHLSAFDEGARTRANQIYALKEIARKAYARGDHVIIGGDWNLRLSPAAFPHTTAAKDLFWVHDVPADALPEGWHWAVDHTVPTVRTMQKPFVRGENFTFVIDGFAVSPNVEILDVTATDLGFEQTDHHPVLGRFRAIS